MNRVSTIVRSSLFALVVGVGAIGSTGCSTVREHQVDAATGQVTTVNRRQFIGKAIFNRGRDKTTYVNGNPEMASGQMNGQFAPQYAPQQQSQFAPQYAPQNGQQFAPQYAPQNNGQFVPQNAPQYAPQNAPAQYAPNANGNMGGTQTSPFGRLGG